MWRWAPSLLRHNLTPRIFLTRVREQQSDRIQSQAMKTITTDWKRTETCGDRERLISNLPAIPTSFAW